MKKVIRNIKGPQSKNVVLQQIEKAATFSISPEECKKLCNKAGITYKEGYEERVIPWVCSTEEVDRDGDIIKQNWDLKNFKSNPVILLVHNYGSFPIGASLKTFVEDKALNMWILIADEETYKEADTAFKLAKSGFLKGGSVGFNPIEYRNPTDEEREELGMKKPWGVIFEKLELLEFSLCPVGSNGSALKKSIQEGIITEDDFRKIYISKNVIPYEKQELAPEDEDLISYVMDTVNIKQLSAWHDSEHPDNMNSYKFIHHDSLTNKTVWKGVDNSMAQLMGFRGGTDIPEEDREGVYNHLVKHYEEFNKIPPGLKTVNEIHNYCIKNPNMQEKNANDSLIKQLKELVKTEEKTGAVLSQKNKKLIVDAVSKMREAADALDQLVKDSSNKPDDFEENKSIEDDDSVIHIDLDTCEEPETGLYSEDDDIITID